MFQEEIIFEEFQDGYFGYHFGYWNIELGISMLPCCVASSFCPIQLKARGDTNRNCLGHFREIPWNQTTVQMYIDDATDYMTLTLYNVTLTSQ